MMVEDRTCAMGGTISMAAFLGSFLIISGCASSGNEWVKDQTPPTAMQQDLAECKYQAESSTATIGTTDHPSGFGNAVSQGIGDGIVKGMEQADLIKDCMNARGYSRQ